MLKRCTGCDVEKPLSDFRKDTSKKDGHRYECKVCSRTRINSVYTQKYSIKCNARSKSTRIERVELVKQHKQQNPCVVCGEAEPACLDFHHKEASEKENSIAQMLNGSLLKLLTEMAKCVILCSNCHRKVHAGIIVLDKEF